MMTCWPVFFCPSALAVGIFVLNLSLTGCAVGPYSGAQGIGRDVSKAAISKGEEDWPIFELQAEEFWWLNAPEGERFDASGLLWTHSGELWTVNDRGARLYKVEFLQGQEANLLPVPGIFTEDQLAPFAAEKLGRYDAEGLAQDEAGRIYLCEEANRWVLRYDARMNQVERLAIDWSPVQRLFHPSDRNASFEGMAVGGGKLYLANERQVGGIIVVDLDRLEVVDDFVVRPKSSRPADVVYSDLCWKDGFLYVLLRQHQRVLKVAPETRRVVAEFSYGTMERAPEVAYRTWLPLGLMEGIAVTEDFIWLVADNNGLGRMKNPRDIRPVLFRCRRSELE